MIFVLQIALGVAIGIIAAGLAFKHWSQVVMIARRVVRFSVRAMIVALVVGGVGIVVYLSFQVSEGFTLFALVCAVGVVRRDRGHVARDPSILLSRTLLGINFNDGRSVGTCLRDGKYALAHSARRCTHLSLFGHLTPGLLEGV